MVSFFSVISGLVFLGLTSPANGGDQHQYEMVKPTVNSEISQGPYFCKTSHMRSFVKINPPEMAKSHCRLLI